MNDADAKILELLLAEIRDAKPDSQAETTPNQARVLGAFIDAVLANNSRTREDLARRLDMEIELVDAICEGDLPEAIISDQTLLELASALQYEPNVLRALLGRMNKAASEKNNPKTARTSHQ
jgi:hypothetical protein